MNISRLKFFRLFCAPALVVSLLALPVQSSEAAKRPDPVVATLISLGSTLIPVAMGTILWTQDRGINEGFRYDMGFVFIGVGGILGPSTGKFYADKESDAWISLMLRGVTGSLGLMGTAFWLRGEKAQTRNNGRALAGIGMGATGLLGLYDIWTSGSAALETQRERGYGPRTSLIKLRPSEGLAHGLNQQWSKPHRASISRKHLPQPQFLIPAKETLLLPSKPLGSEPFSYLTQQ